MYSMKHYNPWRTSLTVQHWLYPWVGWGWLKAWEPNGQWECNWYYGNVPTKKKYIDEHGHFSHSLSELMKYDGIGTKIASLVLYFA